MIILLRAFPLFAAPKVHVEIKIVSQHELLVTFSWRAIIKTDNPRQACDLKISFQDNHKREVFTVNEIITLKLGSNVYDGLEICNVADWKKIQKTIVILDCEF